MQVTKLTTVFEHMRVDIII